MLAKEARIKQKGQVTIPVELRVKFELDQGSRVIFEDRETCIAILPKDSLVDQTAGALAEYAKNLPPLTPAEMREAVADAVAEESLETLRQIERDRENN